MNRYAGEAVLRGAQVFSPGLLAASGGLAVGDLVGVSVACELPGSRWCGIARGAVLGADSLGRSRSQASSAPPGTDPSSLPSAVARRVAPAAPLPRSHLFLGVGRCVEGRRGMFRQQSGLAVEMVERVYETPSINGQCDVFLPAVPL